MKQFAHEPLALMPTGTKYKIIAETILTTYVRIKTCFTVYGSKIDEFLLPCRL